MRVKKIPDTKNLSTKVDVVPNRVKFVYQFIRTYLRFSSYLRSVSTHADNDFHIIYHEIVILFETKSIKIIIRK